MEIICFLLKPCISISKTQFSRKRGRAYVRVYLLAQGIHLSILREGMLIKWFCDTAIEIRSKRWRKKLEKSNVHRNHVDTHISLYYLWEPVIYHYLLQYCCLFCYCILDFIILHDIAREIFIMSPNAIRKNIEIIVLWERREVIGRMALEPCNYPAILSLSGRRKVAKQTWNGHYVFPISALTSK